MAKRDELALIRFARAGQAEAQLALAQRYLSGGAGLPASLPTALYWLERAASQDCEEAARLIRDTRRSMARHVADPGAEPGGRPAPLPPALLEQAWKDGERLTYLAHALPAARALWQRHAGPERYRLRAEPAAADCACAGARHGAATCAPAGPGARFAATEAPCSCGPWAAHAAARPAQERMALRAGTPALAADEALLLSRCGQALLQAGPEGGPDTQAEAFRFLQMAAHGGEAHAQMTLGLLLARMDADGRRMARAIFPVNSKLAVRWLTQAGRQGLAQAWYFLARLHSRPDLAQRNPADALASLERAAALGHRAAQLECGLRAWRARGVAPDNDVRAAYWLQLAARQGCAEAAAALDKIAPPRATKPWNQPPAAGGEGVHRLADCEVMLTARLELAALFGLSRVEALLLDPVAADRGHCLLLDIRSAYGGRKRRLVLVRTAEQRTALDRTVRLFKGADCGPDGPEGSYRQRLYRLNARRRAARQAAGQHP
jgi:TPR repeat protein